MLNCEVLQHIFHQKASRINITLREISVMKMYYQAKNYILITLTSCKITFITEAFLKHMCGRS